jgi:hypothetical protein
VGEFRLGRNTIVTSPTKPKTDDLHRVAHGGSWYSMFHIYVSAAYLLGSTPTLLNNSLGFRLTQRGCRGSR